MSMVYGVWPVAGFCPWHQTFDYDYVFPNGAVQWSHVDPQHYPLLGGHWHGIHISENCKWCASPLVATSDPGTNYCPNCGAYQPHRL
jgi:hypothetical protein